MKDFWTACKRAFLSFLADNAPRSAAALAYYTIFAIAPSLLLVLTAAGMAFGKHAADTQILGGLTGVAGTAAGTAIQEMVKDAEGPKVGLIATIVAAMALLFGAAGVFFELRGALNTIWKVRRPEKAGGLVAKGFFSMAMVGLVTVLVLMSLVFDGGITNAGTYAGSHLLGGEPLWKALQLIISAGVATAMFAVIFRFLPDAPVRWRDVSIAAAFTAFLFVLGKFALGLYLGTAAVGSSFGAAGSIIVVLVWVYWSANIFLFGVEFTHVYATGGHRLTLAADSSQERKLHFL